MVNEQTSRRATSFGTVAEDYDRYRPGYRPELLAAIAAYVGPPPYAALEIGAGTGKATVALATLGADLTAVEPDPAMRAVLSRRTAGLPGVRVVAGTFETYDPSAPVRLLAAAAAWHWTDPQSRWGRAAWVLQPGGAIAVLGNGLRLADGDLRQRGQALTAPYITSVPNGPGQQEPSGGLTWPANELAAVPAFGEITQHSIGTLDRMRRADFLGHMATFSACLVLEADPRARLFAELADLLPAEIDVEVQSGVVLARRH